MTSTPTPPAATTHTLLLVDDEPDVVAALRRALRDPTLTILTTTSPLDALRVLDEHPVDLLVTDIDMPHMDGLELVARVREAHPNVVRILLTGNASLKSALQAINRGEVHRYLTKPWERPELRAVVREALDRASELRRVGEAGRSVALRRRIHDELERAHPGITQVPEPGTTVLDPEHIDSVWTLGQALLPGQAWLLQPESGHGRWGDPQAVEVPKKDAPLEGLVLDGRYRIGRQLGAGGFGVVFEGRQLALDRPVAVKMLRPSTGGDVTRHLERFQLEAMSSCRVSHPNAVTVLDAGVSEQGFAYLVMELLQGEVLGARLARGGPWPLARAVSVASEICAALAVAHAEGVLHRDVKPSNVFLHRGPEGEVTKLLDFGIAKLVSLWPSADLTAEDTIVGTPRYMAPERVSRSSVDGRSDVYSVGVLLYEMTTGLVPFSAADPMEAARQQLTVHPRSLQSLDAAVPEAFDHLVQRMLAKRPDARPDAAEAAAALRDWAGRLPDLTVARGTVGAAETEA